MHRRKQWRVFCSVLPYCIYIHSNSTVLCIYSTSGNCLVSTPALVWHGWRKEEASFFCSFSFSVWSEAVRQGHPMEKKEKKRGFVVLSLSLLLLRLATHIPQPSQSLSPISHQAFSQSQTWAWGARQPRDTFRANSYLKIQVVLIPFCPVNCWTGNV